MPIRSYPGRVLMAAGASCLVVLVLCGSVAWSLYREQSRTAELLQQDIGSRGAAINLEATLNNLAILHDRRSRDVAPLHEQVADDLVEIDRFVDKPEEQRLASRVRELFQGYLQRWRADAAPHDLAGLLRHEVVPAVEALRIFNGQELKQSEEEHRRSLRQMAWGLAVVGALGSIAGMVLGYGLARSLQRTIHQFLVRVHGASELLEQEAPLVEWQRTGEPLQDGADDLLRRVEQVVSKLQQREREVRRAERLAAVGQLAAGVAHEIRNPLTSVILLIETARKDPAAGGLTDQDLDLTVAELHRIEQSLQTLLDYARPPKLQRSRVELLAIVENAINLTRGQIERHRVKVRIEAGADRCRLAVDREQLQQVVVNLILNALDAMPDGGTLTFAIRTLPHQRVCELTVTDTGPGIRSDILPRLFEPFATGKETGLGLGLVVSRRIVEDHGGTIHGINPAGGGATFIVRLPANDHDKAGDRREFEHADHPADR